MTTPAAAFTQQLVTFTFTQAESGLAAGERAMVVIGRQGSDGADTETEAALLIDAELSLG